MPVARSRTQRLSSLMNAARVPSGDVTESGGAAFFGFAVPVHAAPPTSHVQRRSPTSNAIAVPSAE